jgi:Zn-dependent protease
VLDLLVAWVGVSFAFYLVFWRPDFSSAPLEYVILTLSESLLVVGTSFALHELLHKFTAQHFGFWSEFRANYATLALSILVAFVIRFVIVVPGATMIYGPTMTKRQNGIISAAGPLLNLALAAIYLLLLPLGGLLSSIGLYGFAINVWLSAFNLLPFGPLDGRKVLDWGVPQYVAIATVPFLAAIFVIFFVFRLL